MISSVDNVRAMLDLARTCAEQGHVTCANPASCMEFLSWARLELDAYQTAAQFELADQAIGPEGPSAATSTAALFACVESSMLVEPWASHGLRRSIWATGALARLAERGIPADSIVRSHMAFALRRKIALHTAIAWSYSNREGTRQGIPYQALAWLERFEQIVDMQASDAPATFVDVLVAASTGKFRRVIDEWLRTTAVAHIIAWRISEPLAVEVPLDCMSCAGGTTATQWIFDRYTKPYLHEWQTESVSWELSFALEPIETARRSGVDIRWLNERPASVALAANTLVRQHTLWHDEPDLILSGVSESDVIEDILHLVNSREIRSAQEFATEVASRNPGSFALRRLFAFTLIPSEPARARRMFLDYRDSAEEWLEQINLACCLIAENKLPAALDLLATVDSSDWDDRDGWLWTPESLVSNQPLVKGISAAEWLSGAVGFLRSASSFRQEGASN